MKLFCIPGQRLSFFLQIWIIKREKEPPDYMVKKTDVQILRTFLCQQILVSLSLRNLRF